MPKSLLCLIISAQKKGNFCIAPDYVLMLLLFTTARLFHYSALRIFISSTAALLTDVPGPKMAATPA